MLKFSLIGYRMVTCYLFCFGRNERRDRYNRDMQRVNKAPSRPDDRRSMQDPRINSANSVNRRQEPQVIFLSLATSL